MQTKKITLWIPKKLLEHIESKAIASFPNETGGSLLGYFSNRKRDIVITSLVDAGPNSRHNTTSFTPDYTFQEEEIGKKYHQSGRIFIYLGDWHTHPNGSLALSQKDVKVLQNISNHNPARNRSPVMVLLAGSQQNWRLKAWQFRPGRKILSGIVFSDDQLIELEIKGDSLE
jgi:integrative and conjugative element protein (TIGR02256 family)